MGQFSCMNKIHEKVSPCCRAKIHKFGNKRRQCSGCKRTWTLWAKKRGRNPLRPSHNLLHRVVVEKQSLLSPRFNRQQLTEGALSIRLRRTMEKFLERIKPNTAPRGRLILVIDALWYLFGGKRWTLYLMALRATHQDKAIIIEPVLCQGRENYDDWQAAIASIPAATRQRTVALVSDGFRGSDRIARDHGWIMQRCHFHLIAQLQVNRGHWKQLRDSKQREAVYQAIRNVLTARPKKLKRYVHHLTILLEKNDCPKRLGMIGREFLRRLDQFRSYQNFPDLCLPHTTNSIESFNNIIRSRCRHLRTPGSLLLRTKVIIRMRKTITCKPKIFQQK